MAQLSDNWLTEGLLDAEYKRYQLLAYLQGVAHEFASWRVYPSLAELGRHYDNLYAFRRQQEALRAAFPREVTGADFEEARLTYRPTEPEAQAMAELSEVVDFALPALSERVEEGKELYNQVEADLTISPLGLMPLRREVGYAFVHTRRRAEVDVYAYSLRWAGLPEAPARSLEWRFVEQAQHSLSNTFEQIRYQVIRQHHGAAPATYLIEARAFYPTHETLLPVAKRKLVRMLATG